MLDARISQHQNGVGVSLLVSVIVCALKRMFITGFKYFSVAIHAIFMCYGSDKIIQHAWTNNCHMFFFAFTYSCTFFDNVSSPSEGIGNLDKKGITRSSPMELFCCFFLFVSPFLRFEAAGTVGGPCNCTSNNQQLALHE